MWDTIRDCMIWIIGALLTGFQIWQGFKNKKSGKTIFFLILVFFAFIGLGIWQTISNANEKDKITWRLNSLDTMIKTIQAAKTQDSLEAVKKDVKDSVFQKRLFDQYKIIRDSATNQPRAVNNIYNTNFNKRVDKVDIGTRTN